MTLASKVVLLKDGEIVQIASPTELYAHPVNRFAATFIGSPQINLVKGDLSAEGWFNGGGLHVELPRSVFADVPKPGPVELGLRSEDADITNSNKHMTLKVDYVEPTGSDLFVNGIAAGQEIVVRVDRTTVVGPGDEVPIRWDLNAALVFDASSGARL
jgi:ABC-type sugar transport system ATPase subunit